AAFFTTTSFWHVVFSRAGLRAVSAPCFLTWSIYFLALGFRRARERKPATATMMLAGVLYGLGFHTYIAYRATPLLIGAVLAYEAWSARKGGWLRSYWTGAGVFSGAAAIVVAPLAAYFVLHAGSFGQRTASISVFRMSHPLLLLLPYLWHT